MFLRLASNIQRSAQFCLLNSRIKGVHHSDWLENIDKPTSLRYLFNYNNKMEIILNIEKYSDILVFYT